MKKFTAVLLVLIVALVMTVGCAEKLEKFTCGFCKQKVNSIPHQVTYKGEDMKVCDDCFEGFKKMGVLD